MGAICHQWGKHRYFNSFRSSSITLAVLTCVLVCAPIAVAELVANPSASGAGYYDYSESTLTLTDVKINQITFGFSMGPPYPHTVTAPEWVTDPVAGTGANDGAVAELLNITYDGSGYDFSDGTFKLSLGSDVVMTANMVDVALVPTATNTAMINSGLAGVNLTNVVVTQPTAGTSQFVTDWLSASEGSGLGALALTFTNTLEGGEFEAPYDSESGGSVLLTLQPVTPEPASALLILLGSLTLSINRRRR